MACVARLGIGHVDAWRLPIDYAVAMLDAARAAESRGKPDGRADDQEQHERIVTPDGIAWPSGLSALAMKTAGLR